MENPGQDGVVPYGDASVPTHSTCKPRWFWLALLGICAVCLVIRVLIVLEAWHGNPLAVVPMQDAAVYWTWAGQIANGHTLSDTPFFSAPLYPYLLGLIRAVGGGLPTVYGLQIAVHMLSVAWIGCIGARRFGLGVGLAAAGLFALLTEPAFFTGRVLNCTLQLFLVCALWGRMLAAQHRPTTHAWLTVGILVGLNCLANPPMVLALVGLGPWVFWHTSTGWRGVRSAALAVLVALLVVSPATVHNYLVCREFIPISAHGGVTFYAGNCPGASGTYQLVSGVAGTRQEQNATAQRSYRQETGRSGTWNEINSFFFRKGLAYWKADPRRFLRLILHKLHWFLTGRNYGDIYLPTTEMQTGLSKRLVLAPLPVAWLSVPALLALGAMLRRAKRYAPELALFGIPVLVVALFWYSPRYRLPAVPVIVVAVAWAFQQGLHWRQHLRWSVGVAAALVVSIALGAANRVAGRDRPESYRAQFEYFVGWALDEQGRTDEAIQHYRSAVDLDPQFRQAEYSLCNALREQGRLDEALDRLKRAAAADPEDLELRNELANVLAKAGRVTEALQQYEALARLGPPDPRVHLTCGNLAAQQGLYATALRHYDQALQVSPTMASASYRKGVLLIEHGQFTAGIEALRNAHQIAPRRVPFARALAWQLATHPHAATDDRTTALSIARKANEQSGNDNPRVLDALAAALAANGQFHTAVTTAQRAIDLADRRGAENLALGLRERLRLYEARRPYIQPTHRPTTRPAAPRS